MGTSRVLALGALLVAGAGASADETVWLNVPNFPDDLFGPIDGWSAVRIEAPEFLSLRCAADDFILDRPARISAVTFYGAEIGDPVIEGGDVYIYEWAGGAPGTLLYSGQNLPMEHEVIGDNPGYGPVYRNTVHPVDLTLDPGAYFLGFRTYQGKTYDPDGKNTNGAFSTRSVLGSSAAWWSFDVQPDGSGGGWVPLENFNLSKENEWCFRIEAETPDQCYADCTGEDTLDLFDFLCYVNSFNAGEESAECDGDTGLTLFDFLCYVNAFNAGC
jgi:hypothetical protein